MSSAKEKPPALMTDGDDNTKDSITMSILWCSCIYIPRIISGHHKQTNLPSGNSPLDMLMTAMNECIREHGLYLFLSKNFFT
jgi:hypothetical protein